MRDSRVIYLDNPNPYANLFGLLGMIMGNNAKQREEDKIKGAISDTFSPSGIDTNTGETTTTQMTPQGKGLFASQLNPSDQDKYRILPKDSMFTPQPSQDKFSLMGKKTMEWRPTPADGISQSSPLGLPSQQPTGDNLYNGIFSKDNMTTTTKQRTINDVNSDIRSYYAQKLKDLSGKVPLETLRQLLPMVKQQMSEEMAQAKGDYDKRVKGNFTESIINAKTPEEQKQAWIKYAKETGDMDAATLKGLLTTNQQKVDDGANYHFFRTDQYGNYMDVGGDGKPVPYYSMPKQMSPEQQDQSARGWYAINNPPSRGGRDNTHGGSDESGMSPEEARQYRAAMSIISQHDKWIKDRKDWLGVMPDPTESPYHNDALEAQKIVRGILRKTAGTTGAAPPTAKDAFVKAVMEQKGLTKEEAEAEWNKRQGKGGSVVPQSSNFEGYTGTD